jgi:hypothetical protein
MTYSQIVPYVGFNMENVALYMSPAGHPHNAKRLALKLSRDNTLGESCPNVQLIRKMEAAAMAEIDRQTAEGLRQPHNA